MKQNDFLYSLGKRIANIRKARKYSQEDVCAAIGFMPNTISALECGKTDSKILTYQTYADFLGVSLAQLISDAEIFPLAKSKKLEELVELLKDKDDVIIDIVLKQSQLLLSAIDMASRNNH